MMPQFLLSLRTYTFGLWIQAALSLRVRRRGTSSASVAAETTLPVDTRRDSDLLLFGYAEAQVHVVPR
jgi:hypothetical protein